MYFHIGREKEKERGKVSTGFKINPFQLTSLLFLFHQVWEMSSESKQVATLPSSRHTTGERNNARS